MTLPCLSVGIIFFPGKTSLPAFDFVTPNFIGISEGIMSFVHAPDGGGSTF